MFTHRLVSSQVFPAKCTRSGLADVESILMVSVEWIVTVATYNTFYGKERLSVPVGCTETIGR